jgi:hypothetical protein
MKLIVLLILWLLGVIAPLVGGICLVVYPARFIDQINSHYIGSACYVDWLVVNYTVLTIEVNIIINLSRVPSAVGKNVTIFPDCGILWCTEPSLRALQIEYHVGATFGCYVCECVYVPVSGCECIDVITQELYGYNIPDYISGYGLVLFGIVMTGPSVWYTINR